MTRRGSAESWGLDIGDQLNNNSVWSRGPLLYNLSPLEGSVPSGDGPLFIIQDSGTYWSGLGTGRSVTTP